MALSQVGSDNFRVVVVRLAPGRETQLEHCLNNDQIVIGWENAHGLIDQINWERFRSRGAVSHYPDDPSLRKAGAAAGHLWRYAYAVRTVVTSLGSSRPHYGANGERWRELA